MVTTQGKTTEELSETEALIEEFKQRLNRTLLQDKARLHEMADREAKNIMATAYQEAARLNEKARQDAEAVIDRARVTAAQATESEMTKATFQAEQVIKNAEERIRKEAKERTKKEVDSILRKTTEDSSKQVATILQTAREEASLLSKQMLIKAENESREMMRSAADLHEKATEELAAAQKKSSEAVEVAIAAARQTAQVQGEKEAQEIISRAKSIAQKERELLIAQAAIDARKSVEKEAAALLEKAKFEAEEIINQARNKVRTQIEESSRLMQEIHQKMQQVIGVPSAEPPKRISIENALKPETETKPKIESPREVTNIKIESLPITHETSPSSAQSKINSLFSDDATLTHTGRLKIDIAPPSDNEQIAALERQLATNIGLRLIAKGGAEDGSAWLEIELSNPFPLVDFLRKSSTVKDVVGARSYIIVTLKSGQAA